MSVPVRIDFTDDFRIDVLLQNGAFIELAADEYPRCLLKGDSPVSELRGKRGLRNLVAVPSGELAEYGEILPVLLKKCLRPSMPRAPYTVNMAAFPCKIKQGIFRSRHRQAAP